jgi:hypothetical protein
MPALRKTSSYLTAATSVNATLQRFTDDKPASKRISIHSRDSSPANQPSSQAWDAEEAYPEKSLKSISDQSRAGSLSLIAGIGRRPRLGPCNVATMGGRIGKPIAGRCNGFGPNSVDGGIPKTWEWAVATRDASNRRMSESRLWIDCP